MCEVVREGGCPDVHCVRSRAHSVRCSYRAEFFEEGVEEELPFQGGQDAALSQTTFLGEFGAAAVGGEYLPALVCVCVE